MRMILYSSFISVICLMSLSGCEKVSGYADQFLGQSGNSYLEASLDEATAERCAEFCELITLKITVVNQSKELLCIPSVYDDQFVDSATVFMSARDKSVLSSITPSDPNVFLSKNYRDSMMSLKNGSQYIVQPGGVKILELHMFKKFNLIKQPTIASVRFMGFPCDDRAFKKYGHRVLDITHDVTFK